MAGASPPPAPPRASKVSAAGESSSARSTRIRLHSPGARRETSTAKSRSPVGSQMAGRRERVAIRRSLHVERGAAQTRHAQALEGYFRPGFDRLQRHRSAVDLRFADAGDMQRARIERNRKVHVADHVCDGEARQRVDVERIGCEVEGEAGGVAAGRTCEGKRAGQRRSIQRQLEIAQETPGRRGFDLALERGAAIGERFARLPRPWPRPPARRGSPNREATQSPGC